MEFEKTNAIGKKMHPTITHSWKPPPDGFYKINTDGSYNLNSRSEEWGFVIRDTIGDVCWAAAGNITRAASALQTEAIAALKAIQQAVQLGMTHIILEMDALVLASTLTSTRFDRSVMGCLVRKIQDLMQCNVVKCNRLCNKVADCLATYAACLLASAPMCFGAKPQSL
jgi:ribonuclease HI